MHYPKISILVPTYNEEKHIEKCLKSLLNQTYKGEFEIIVIDGKSTDNTTKIVNELCKFSSKIILLTNPLKIQSSGRNIGINYSNSEYIAYLDAHSYIEPNWLEQLWSTFHTLTQIDKMLAGVGSVYEDANHTSFTRSLSRAYRSILIGSSSKSFLNKQEVTKVDNGYGFLYKKNTLIEAGLYDESLKTAEDIELNFRLSYKLGFNLYIEPKAIAYYYFKEKPKDVFSQQFRYGFWRIQAMKKLGIYNLKVFIPGIAIIILFIIIATTSHFNELRLMAIAFGLYLITIVFSSVYESIKFKINFFYFLINIISIQFGYGCGVLIGIFYAIFKKKDKLIQ